MNYLKRLFGLCVLVVMTSFWSCSRPGSYTLNTSSTSNAIANNLIDSSFVNMIQPYKAKLDAQMNRVIGFSEKELFKGPSQSTLGNFIIDLILVKSEEYYEKPIDFALVTTGGLRTPIPKGNVTVGNIYELMPFENELVILTLPGSAVQKLMEHSAKEKNTQFAGLTYTLSRGQLQDIKIDGKEFDVNKSYTMAVSDYLANGGDKLTFLKEASNYYQLGKSFRGAILEYIETLTADKKNIVGKIDNRVVIEN